MSHTLFPFSTILSKTPSIWWTSLTWRPSVGSSMMKTLPFSPRYDAIFSLWSSPPDSVERAWFRCRYPRPISIIGLSFSSMTLPLKNSIASRTLRSITCAISSSSCVLGLSSLYFRASGEYLSPPQASQTVSMESMNAISETITPLPPQTGQAPFPLKLKLSSLTL